MTGSGTRHPPFAAHISRAAAVVLLAVACSGGGGGDASTGPPASTPGPVLTSVVITAPTSTLSVGQTTQLTASPRDQADAAISAAVTWSSSAEQVATVSASGLVTAVGAGTATITAQASRGQAFVSSTKTITVQAVTPVLTSVSVSAPATSVTVGQTVQLSAAPKDQNGSAIAATVTWSTSASAVATVSATGLVTGAATGTATITAQASAGGTTASGTISITVLSPTPVLTSVAISAPSTSVNVGQTLQLSASPRDQFGSGIAATLAWSSSATAVATVSSTGLVSGVAAGSATIGVIATSGGTSVSASMAVTVTTPFPLSATVETPGNFFSPGTVDIARGGTVTWNLGSSHNVIFSTAGSPEDIPVSAGASRTFSVTGTYNYQCTIHPGMVGTVIVH